MVNVENPDYALGLAKGYFVKNSKGLVRPFKWWHGQGALLDYTNPEAVSWWHGLMDKVLDAGVDGFKCDGTDPYIQEYTLTGGAFGYDGKEITYEDYAHAYYRDFFYYTRQKRSDPSYSKVSNFDSVFQIYILSLPTLFLKHAHRKTRTLV